MTVVAAEAHLGTCPRTRVGGSTLLWWPLQRTVLLELHTGEAVEDIGCLSLSRPCAGCGPALL